MSKAPALSATALEIRSSVFADLAPRIEAFARRGGRLIELHIGDTHRAPPEGARFSTSDEGAFDVALYRYGAVGGMDALRDAFATRLRASGHGPADVDPEKHVLVACGATHAIFCAARAVLDPGDEVLVASPYWPLTVGVLRAAGAIPVEVPLTSRLYADPALDPGALLETALSPRTRAIYITTPNNPDGKVLSKAQLTRVARVAIERNLWVISDEVYAEYVYQGVHASIARIDGMAERTLSAYSLSKSHALAGARVGFAVAPEAVVRVARRIATHTVFNVPVAAQRVALAALRSPDTWVDEARRDYRAARDATLRALDGSGARTFAPEGGSYAFVDFDPVLGKRPLTTLLERAIDKGVLLAPGDGFGDGFASWARLCFTSVPRPDLLLGIARLREAIAEL
ncbi:MAG: pyridoxal phosphate-dependent aminotransferase [Polyangiaceae bacterium]